MEGPGWLASPRSGSQSCSKMAPGCVQMSVGILMVDFRQDLHRPEPQFPHLSVGSANMGGLGVGVRRAGLHSCFAHGAFLSEVPWGTVVCKSAAGRENVWVHLHRVSVIEAGGVLEGLRLWVFPGG